MTTRSSAATTTRNNAFLYGDDRRGLKCPAGAHARRANPRDAFDEDGSVDVRLHRMIRRGTSYGPILPDGVLEDDGADRGIVFVFAGSHLKRQFEFVKTQWLNDGIFIGAPQEQDPLVGTTGRDRRLHHPQATHQAPATGDAAVRRYARRRVLLRARPSRAALARRTRHLGRSTQTGGAVAASSDKHRSLESTRLRAAACRGRGARQPGAPGVRGRRLRSP